MAKNKFEKSYKKILTKALTKGIFRNDRTGVGSYSLFNKSIKIDLNKGFPIITGRKMEQKIFETEFLWFLKGETSIKRFQDKGIKIWDSWANEIGELGPVYGYQMNNFNGSDYNQYNALIEGLINNKDGRRHIITLWNPLQLNQMRLPPCYLYFQFYVEGNNINMFVVQRSADLFLGVPYDICLFSLFLLDVAKKAGYKAKKIEVNFVDAHIYKNQINSVIEYLKQPIFSSPQFTFVNNKLSLFNYKINKTITAAVAV